MTFSELKLPANIEKALKELGYSNPTSIQQKTIPLLFQGKDVIGQSQTGSGKTAAFGLPIVSHMKPGQGIQALILTPTRELCVQVSEAIRGFAKYTSLKIIPVFGGVGIGSQLHAIRTADVVVATPGRLLDIMQRGVRLSTVKFLVLDEADRMLDMGFIDDVERIIQSTPKQRQTILFSATLSPKLRSIVNRHMKEPAVIQTKTQVDTHLLTEKSFFVPSGDKVSLLVHCLKKETPGIAIIFCGTRHGCDKIARRLRAEKIDATPIHGGLAQTKRMHVIEILHKRGVGVLVATDVASRGIHVSNVSHVYNYDLPQTHDDYIHRIGRTARAGASGEAITFVSREEERDYKHMMRNLGRNITPTPLPAFEKIPMPQGGPGGPENNRDFYRHKRHKDSHPSFKK